MTEKEMQKYIEKTDQYRGDFYRYHTGHEWVDARNYDLCLNSGKLGFEKCVEEIKAYIKVRFGEAQILPGNKWIRHKLKRTKQKKPQKTDAENDSIKSFAALFYFWNASRSPPSSTQMRPQ